MPNIPEIKKNLETKWLAFLSINAPKLTVKNLSGATPPSVFVGHTAIPR